MGITAGIIFLAFALGGISFFFSYLFDRTNLSIALGAGIPTFFLLVRMLHNASPKADVLRYSTIFSLHEPLRIAQANPVTLELLVLGVPGIGLSVAGMRLFTKKNFHDSVKSVDRSLLSSEVYVAYPLSIMQPPTPKRNPLVASVRLYQFLALDTHHQHRLIQ